MIGGDFYGWNMTEDNVFTRQMVHLIPRDLSTFIASDSESLTGDPAALRDRFKGIEQASRVFNPQA